jgi:hypothetical protein
VICALGPLKHWRISLHGKSYPQLRVGVIVQLPVVIDPIQDRAFDGPARHGPLMPAMQGARRLDKVTRQWRDLADRRLEHFTELYQSGRWKHHYTKERFASLMVDVIKATKVWRELASRPVAERVAARDDDLRPAA